MNPTVALTLILLSLMTGAGIVTGAWGYAMGREALKGITQPELRPTAVSETRRKPKQETMMIIPEEQILAEVTARITGKPLPAATPVAAAPTPAAAAETPAAAPVGLPVVGEAQGVKLEVRSVEQQGDALVMNVALTNSSGQPVRFLYSFLSLTDNQGRSLDATTDGLPGELPSGSETFTGTINVSSHLLEGAETLNLSLPDYPDQQITVQLSGIPVVR